MTPVSIEEDQQQEQVELELTEAAAGGSQADLPQAAATAAPEQTYDSLFPALPMGSTKPARPAATNVNATPMVKVTSSRITQVRGRRLFNFIHVPVCAQRKLRFKLNGRPVLDKGL